MTTPAGWHPDPEGSGRSRWWDGQQWTSALQPNPTNPPSAQNFFDSHANPEPRGAKKKWPWIVAGVLALFVVIGLVNSGGESSDSTAANEITSTPVTAESTAPATPIPPAPPIVEELPVETVQQAPPAAAEPAPPAVAELEPAAQQPGMTTAQRNAVRSAESYLDYTGFSRQGLIGQLEYEDYSTEDATFAVDYVAPNWNEQAVSVAESYLDYTSFSRQGLIDQLIFDGFSPEQAQFGVDGVGL